MSANCAAQRGIRSLGTTAMIKDWWFYARRGHVLHAWSGWFVSSPGQKVSVRWCPVCGKQQKRVRSPGALHCN